MREQEEEEEEERTRPLKQGGDRHIMYVHIFIYMYMFNYCCDDWICVYINTNPKLSLIYFVLVLFSKKYCSNVCYFHREVATTIPVHLHPMIPLSDHSTSVLVRTDPLSPVKTVLLVPVQTGLLDKARMGLLALVLTVVVDLVNGV